MLKSRDQALLATASESPACLQECNSVRADRSRERRAMVGVLLAFSLSFPAAAYEINDRFRIDLHVTAGIMIGEWNRFDPPLSGTAPLVAEASLGIPEDGLSADHWAVAARGTYTLRTRNVFVLQLSHRRFSESPLTDAEDPLELDWLYYERLFGTSTSVRLGRTPISFGLLNEVRDQGIDLPFFRVPFAFYDEGGFITETVDGGRLHHRIGRSSGWALEFDIYAGRWELLEMAGAVNRLAGSVDGIASRIETVDVNQGYGWSVWARAPRGLRLGAGEQRFSSEGGSASHLPGEETDWEHDFVSFEIDNSRFLFRAEYRQARFPVNFTTAAVGLPVVGLTNAGFLTEAETGAWYVQAGLRYPGGWSFTAQIQRGGEFFQCFILEDLRCDPLNPEQDLFLNKPHGERTWVDEGVVVRYDWKHGLVFRVEYHRTDGLGLQRFDGSRFFGLTRRDPTETGSYGLISFSWQG